MRRLVCTLLLTITLGYTLFQPTVLMAVHRQQPEVATILIENVSDQTITICNISAVGLVSDEVALTVREKVVLAPTESKDFTLPPDVYHLTLADCEQKSLFQRTIELTDHFIVKLGDKVMASIQELYSQTDTGTILNDTGWRYYTQGQYPKALQYYTKALAIHRETGNLLGEGRTLNNIGVLYNTQGQYTKALEYHLKALIIHQHSGSQQDKALTLNNIGMVYVVQSDNLKALEAFQQALAIYRLLGNKQAEGMILGNMGSIYQVQGRFVEALEIYQQTLAIDRATNNQQGIARNLNGIGSIHLTQGQLSKALDFFQQALMIQQVIGDKVGEEWTLNNINLVYLVQGQYEQALTYYQQALITHHAVGNQVGEIFALQNIAAVYSAQGQYHQALEYLEQALTLVRGTTGNRFAEGAALSLKGSIYTTQGKYAQSLDSLQQALAIYREIGNLAVEGAIYNSIGTIYFIQGQDSKALDNSQRALIIAQKLGIRSTEANALNNIGTVYFRQKQYHKAMDNFQQALAIYQMMRDEILESLALTHIAAVYREQLEYNKAFNYSQRALVIAQKWHNLSVESITLSNLGYLSYIQGHYNEAQETFQKALSLLRTLGNSTAQASILYLIGLAYHRQERYVDALYSYQQAIELAESVRAIAGSELGRAGFIAQGAELYERAALLYYQQGQHELAFFTSERGRARALLDALATGAVQLSDEEANTLLSQEQEAYAFRQASQDVLIRARTASPSDSQLIADLEQQLQKAEEQHSATLSAIDARNDQLTALLPSRTKHVLSVNEVQKQLPAQTTLLSYWLGEDKSLAFLITIDDFKVVELPDTTTSAVDAAVASLYQWSNPENPHPRSLRNLYQWLVEPFAAYLHTPHIAIIPHQALHYVPFAALTDGQTYFGEQYLLTQLPSASIIPFLKENEAKAAQNGEAKAVVLGNPVTTLSALPSAEAEAVEVADLLSTTVYTGTAASELQLRTVVSGASVLHLAAHGNYNPANALYSAIALATDENEVYDGLLETHEIFGLPLQGNALVMLSACETNVGAISRGDEVVGLTRAFFFAGSPTVISSLWNVDDSATGALMTAFYRHWLKEGMSKAEALQAAQADVRANQQWASPFYWAGFVLNGDGGH